MSANRIESGGSEVGNLRRLRARRVSSSWPRSVSQRGCRPTRNALPDWGDDQPTPVRDFLHAVALVVVVFGSLILAAWWDMGGRG